jgi:peptidoglycan pentaglycine glycine transferase (the first glycine)
MTTVDAVTTPGQLEWDHACEEDWDAFLERTPGGHYRQSSRWAATKRVQGWSAERLTARRAGELVAGAQLLIRPLPRVPQLGRLALCPKGPLLHDDDPALATAFVARLHQHCLAQRIRVLLVQPPEHGPSLTGPLEGAGYLRSPVPIAPRATALVDLAPGIEALEQRLGKNLRRQLRRAERRGMQIRRGSVEDVATLHHLLRSASERLDYRLPSAAYYRRLWGAFAPGERAQVFVAEHDGTPVAASLCLLFGDRLVSTAAGWSGSHGRLHPNDLLDWHTIRWAQQRGLRYVELENLSYELAVRIGEGEDPNTLEASGADRYKLKWATDVVAAPVPYLAVTTSGLQTVLRRLPTRALDASLGLLAAKLRPLRE